ncbi:MAG TPA: cytochrome c3 family protein [Planctomycetaceae bacterium]
MERKNTDLQIPAAAGGFAAWRVVTALAVLLVLGGVTAAWLLAPWPPEEKAAPRAQEQTAAVPAAYQPPSDEGYVGSAACAQCHAEIAESFKTHPMSRSISFVDPHAEDASLPREETRVAGTTRVYEVEVRDGVMYHHEGMFDAAGEEIYDQALPVDYVVGSGRRAKAYLHQRGDLLFMSPLNWYTQAGKWDMAPGYTPEDPRRFSRRVNDECLSCHAGRVAPVGRKLDKYAKPAFREAAIGCENCHGPGERHVALHGSGTSVGPGEDPIVNPADLDHDRRESVCYQCHLQAAVRITRHGRSDLDFRPGMRLDEIWTVLDAGSDVSEDGRTRSVNHVQQMRESRCFVESKGRLGCISCHDPHRVPSEAEQVEFYRQKCFTCHTDESCSLSHEQRLEKEDSCVACHMPARDTSNVSHVTQTDHRVLRNPESAPQAAAEPAADTLTFFDRADRRLGQWERGRAMGLGAWTHLVRTDRPPSPALGKFLHGLVEQVPDDGALLTALGSMAQLGGRTEQARSYFEAARKIPSAEEKALSGLLDIYYGAAEREKALECADRLIEIDSYDARTHAIRADLLTSLGRASEGIASAERALELNPTLIPVREWLADAYRAVGRIEEQREQEEIVRRMRSARVPARSGRGPEVAPESDGGSS